MATEASLKELTVRLEARWALTLAALMNIRAQGSGGVEFGAKTPAANVDLRGGKGSLHEGGARVPTIFYWPAKLKLRIVNEPFGMVDMMPTLPALAGANGSPDHPFDGRDISGSTWMRLGPSASFWWVL